VRLVEMKE